MKKKEADIVQQIARGLKSRVILDYRFRHYIYGIRGTRGHIRLLLLLLCGSSLWFIADSSYGEVPLVTRARAQNLARSRGDRPRALKFKLGKYFTSPSGSFTVALSHLDELPVTIGAEKMSPTRSRVLVIRELRMQVAVGLQSLRCGYGEREGIRGANASRARARRFSPIS